MRISHSVPAALLAWSLLVPLSADRAHACACGCGVFEIGTASLLPSGPGFTTFLEYDFADQNRNWSGTSRAPASNNEDKDIRTSFLTLGVQYMSDNGWGLMAQVPYWQRHFETEDNGVVAAIDHGAIGDVCIEASYAGFFDDRSTGIIARVKLPTGDFQDPHFDRDTEIGTGSTDIIAGIFHHGALDDLGTWNYFAEAQYELAVATQGEYRPGNELNVTAGLVYSSFDLGGGVTLSPLAKLTFSARERDSGLEAAVNNSGYERVLVAAGAEVDVDQWRFYGDVEAPVYERVKGNQLVAPLLVKVVAAYSFP